MCIFRLEKKEKLRKEREKQKEEDEVVEIKKEKKRVSQTSCVSYYSCACAAFFNLFIKFQGARVFRGRRLHQEEKGR